MERFLGCNACQATFKTPEEHKLHYTTDWHRYNLKRKIGEMGSVTEEEFNRRKAAELIMADESVPNSGLHHCKYCNKTFSSKNAEESHLKSKKHKFNIKLYEKKKTAEQTESTAEATPEVQNTKEIVVEEEDNEEGKEITETEKKVIPDTHEYELNECFFCNEMSGDIESNLEHMLKMHGFFIPEAEYLVNIEGLLKYIGNRIGVEHVCLNCQFLFKSVNALKDHMISKCHCRLLWDDDVDVGEYEEFFDFTKNDKDDEDDTPLDPAVVDANGELRLPNGNILGNRIYKRYYKQYYKPIDTRPSVVANKLLLLYRQNHIDTNTTLAKTDYRIQQIVRRHKKMDIDGFVNYDNQKLKIGVRTNKLNRKYYRSQTG